MSKNIREQISEEVGRRDAMRNYAMDSYNQAITNELSDFYKENEDNVNIITDKLIDAANCQLEYGAAKGFRNGYDAGYDDGVAKGIGIGSAIFAAAGVAGCAYIYKDQIKEYGKYVIGKFKKGRD